MFPKALKVSYSALLSMVLSKFLIKMFPTPDRRSDGSRWDHMILMGRALMLSKFIVSKARSAEREGGGGRGEGGGREGGESGNYWI